MNKKFFIVNCLSLLLSCCAVTVHAENENNELHTSHVFPVTRENKERMPNHNAANSLQATFAQYNYTDEAYLYRLHATAFHHIIGYSDSGDIVQLYDASKWFVHPAQRYNVLRWVQSDDIFIKPRSSCFSAYKYVLYNRTTQEAVEVNLAAAPLPMGAYTLTIVNIDTYQNLIQLSDNTVWTINTAGNAFAYWNIGQRVLVGVNNRWHTATYPQILINADVYGEPNCLVNFYGYGIN